MRNLQSMTAKNIATSKPPLVETLLAKGFRLSGSRLLGTWHDNSDWDLYAEYTDEVSKELELLRFQKIKGAGYDDDENTVAIFEAYDFSGEVQVLVQVSLVTNVQAKANILELLMNNEDWREHDRLLKGTTARNKFWNFLFGLQKDLPG